jgi:solute carrier family 12 sodium/potassium/chloride transporter 2
LITVVNDPNEEENAKEFLKTLTNLARLPQTLTEVIVGDFYAVVSKAPNADLNIFGMDEDLKFEFVKEMSVKTKSSCLFVRDSGHESILA